MSNSRLRLTKYGAAWTEHLAVPSFGLINLVLSCIYSVVYRAPRSLHGFTHEMLKRHAWLRLL